jgi:hypothetical protein
MTARRRSSSWLSLALVLLLTPLAACAGGDDDDDEENRDEAKAVAGTYVGELSGKNAFVAVVASPAAKGREKREVTVYVCDARRLCEWLHGTATGNDFTAASKGGDAKAKGKVSDKSATGTLELSGDDSARYTASRAAAATGLYELKVASDGDLSGASAAGVALKGKSTLPRPGTGSLKLADGTRLKFKVTRDSERDRIPVRAGQVRLIVLPEGELRGAGKTTTENGFFIRSVSG